MQTHICSYYCGGRTHARTVLAREGATAEDIRESLQRGLGDEATVGVVRPAPETDVATAATRMTHSFTIHGDSAAGRPHDPRCCVPWLVFITYAKEAL
jgi:hypothetical protein